MMQSGALTRKPKLNDIDGTIVDNDCRDPGERRSDCHDSEFALVTADKKITSVGRWLVEYSEAYQVDVPNIYGIWL